MLCFMSADVHLETPALFSSTTWNRQAKLRRKNLQVCQQKWQALTARLLLPESDSETDADEMEAESKSSRAELESNEDVELSVDDSDKSWCDSHKEISGE